MPFQPIEWMLCNWTTIQPWSASLDADQRRRSEEKTQRIRS